MAAKAKTDTGALAAQMIADASKEVFAPVYLLMGDEPFYPDMVCKAIMENAVSEDAADFNRIVSYGNDTSSTDIVLRCRRYPMMSDRQLIVVKEAQNLKEIETLSAYCERPLESTVLVLVYRGLLDKRKSLYKTIAKVGLVLESMKIRDYECPRWISSYYASRGLEIDSDAAALLAESCGVDLNRIAVETDKILKNLPEGTSRINARNIEDNVGISREFSIFELTRQLSNRESAKAIKTATYMGLQAGFALPAATGPLFTHFYRILKLEAEERSNPGMSDADKAAMIGVNPFFLREYKTAMRNYPLISTMKIIALLREYDYKSKGGGASTTPGSELMVELVTKILNC